MNKLVIVGRVTALEDNGLYVNDNKETIGVVIPRNINLGLKRVNINDPVYIEATISKQMIILTKISKVDICHTGKK